jgi:hypothetical protein
MFLRDARAEAKGRCADHRVRRAVLADEPDWTGMMEVVPFPLSDPHWQPNGKPVRRARCQDPFLG